MHSESMKLKDILPEQAVRFADDYGFARLLDTEVVETVTDRPFPQKNYTYRNIYVWYLLEDGSAIGFNESPRNGWSFPKVSKISVQKYQ